MTCLLCRSSIAFFSASSYAFMRGFLNSLPKATWKRVTHHACIRVMRSNYLVHGFDFRCFSSRESVTSGTSKEVLKLLMEEESDAFYVVRKGDIIGVYKSLNDCQAQISTSVCNLSVSVYKGYSLHKSGQDYLASCGFKGALYSMHATHLKEDLFGTLVPCPFKQPDKLAFDDVKVPKKCSSKRRLKEVMSCVLEFDGASKGNPGKAGAAAVLRNDDGNVVSCIREGLGIATNNVAEYRALILGMKCALDKGFKHVKVQGDSKLICMQVQDLWQIKSPNLGALCKEAKGLKEMFQSFNINHVKRGFNAVADNLAKSAVNLTDGEICEECGPFN